MFFDVTRHGGLVGLRVAVAAVAYLAEAPDGCAMRLIGGETVRVNEDAGEIERRMIEATMPAQAAFVGEAPTADLTELAPVIPLRAEPKPLPSLPRAHNHPKGRRSR